MVGLFRSKVGNPPRKVPIGLSQEVLDRIKVIAQGDKTAEEDFRKKLRKIVEKLNHPNPDMHIIALEELAKIDNHITALYCKKMLSNKNMFSRLGAAEFYLKIAGENPKEYGNAAVEDVGKALKKETSAYAVNSVLSQLSELSGTVNNTLLSSKIDEIIELHKLRLARSKNNIILKPLLR